MDSYFSIIIRLGIRAIDSIHESLISPLRKMSASSSKISRRGSTHFALISLKDRNVGDGIIPLPHLLFRKPFDERLMVLAEWQGEVLLIRNNE